MAALPRPVDSVTTTTSPPPPGTAFSDPALPDANTIVRRCPRCRPSRARMPTSDQTASQIDPFQRGGGEGEETVERLSRAMRRRWRQRLLSLERPRRFGVIEPIWLTLDRLVGERASRANRRPTRLAPGGIEI